MADAEPSQRISLRRGPLGPFVDLTRSLGERAEPFSRRWRGLWRKRWVKVLALIALLPLLAYGVLWMLFARDLPSAESLLNYQPALPTYVRAADGETVQSFARERRVELAYEEYPQLLVDAFTSAEDKTFFDHGGIDWPGTIGAVFDYIGKAGSGDRARGGSTITQQVAKNLLLGDEYSVTRKIKEAFLARRIEATLTKEQILELYLNQIFLGRNAYGVQAASRAYFDKDVDQLELHEAAFLAVLPARQQLRSRAQRRARQGAARLGARADGAQRQDHLRPARAGARPSRSHRAGPSTVARNVGGYYMEEVRRELIARFGENADPTSRTASMPAACGCAPLMTTSCRKRRKRRCATA
jgi:penicillin-binding protein 1A